MYISSTVKVIYTLPSHPSIHPLIAAQCYIYVFDVLFIFMERYLKVEKY